MPTKKKIITFAVLGLIAMGLGYWYGMPKEGSGGGGGRNGGGNTWSLNSVSLNDAGGDINDVFSITWETNGGADTWWNYGQANLNKVKTAIEDVAASRAKVGANIRRLQYTGDQLGALNENLSTSISRIKDVDMATESTRFARYNILTQSGTVMLAQANLLPQNALRLLR